MSNNSDGEGETNFEYPVEIQDVAEPDFDLDVTTDIHIHVQKRGKNFDTIISGLKFASGSEIKAFVSKIKKKYGVGGCNKQINELGKISSIFVFTGDCREKIQKLLIEEYKYSKSMIKIHG